jgi:RimJ/RimL family protein N-acetyltransferase
VWFNVVRGWRGRGLAAEALTEVLRYLTENEGFSVVTARCAADNTAARRALEKSGMRMIRTVQDGAGQDIPICEYTLVSQTETVPEQDIE